MVSVLLPIAVIIDQHLVPRSAVQERNLELQRRHIIFIGRHLSNICTIFAAKNWQHIFCGSKIDWIHWDEACVVVNLIEIDSDIPMNWNLFLILLLMLIAVILLLLSSTIGQEGQVPARLLVVCLKWPSCSWKLQKFNLHNLYSEGAGLDAIISLDRLLLPLVVGDVPCELKHGAANAGGGAPCWGGWTCCIFLSLSSSSTSSSCYIWTCHVCPVSALAKICNHSMLHQTTGLCCCLRMRRIKFPQEIQGYYMSIKVSFHGTSTEMICPVFFPHVTILYLYKLIKSCIMHWS